MIDNSGLKKVVTIQEATGIQTMQSKSAIFGWIMCTFGALFYCYEYLLRISPSVMTNDLMGSFAITAGALGNLIAFYYYIYTPMQLPVGVLMDRFGPKRLLVFACLICAFGSYLFASATHTSVIAIARLLVGFGSAFAFVGVLKLAAIWLPKNRFGMVCGLATALGMVGAMIGDIAMANIVNHHGWRSTVMYSAIVGVVLAIVILFVMKEAGSHTDSHEKTTFKHLLPDLYQLIKNPQIWLNGIIGCLLYLPTSAFAELWGVPYLQSTFDFSRQNAAAAVSMIFLGWAIGGPIAGFISDRVRLRRLPIIIGSIVAALLILVLLYSHDLSKFSVYTILFIFGAFSSAQVLVFAVGREISPAKLSGTSVALTNMLVMLGGVIFQPVVGILLDTRWNGLKANGVPIYTVSDYKFALIILPIGLALSAILMLFMKETYAGYASVKNNAQKNRI